MANTPQTAQPTATPAPQTAQPSQAAPPIQQVPQKKGYGKRPLWQWIALYVVVGGIIYAAVWYFFLRSSGVSIPGY